MSEHKTLWETLLYWRDEASLQAHLMNLELREEWQSLETSFRALEQKFEHLLLQKAEDIGQQEEQYFVGSTDEIKQLVEEFKTLSRKHKP